MSNTPAVEVVTLEEHEAAVMSALAWKAEAERLAIVLRGIESLATSLPLHTNLGDSGSVPFTRYQQHLTILANKAWAALEAS